jgi:anti-sigma regulatory factor (Ser/Thr protein kinase)
MTAAALATRIGMSYDEVDDVRIAVEEAFIYAVDTCEGDAHVTITFLLDEGAMEISTALGSGDAPDDEEGERRTGFAAFILDAVCDEHEFASDESGARSLRLVKRCGSVDAG